jgi:hypothetical protein
MTQHFPTRRDAINYIIANALPHYPVETTLAGHAVYTTAEVRIDPNTVEKSLSDLLRHYAQGIGDLAYLKLANPSAANAYIKRVGLTNVVVAYGLKSGDEEWYMLRAPNAGPVGAKPAAARAPVRRAQAGAPSAKALCLEIWNGGTQEREAFVAAAVAVGVKEVTAKTMFSDIRAGRIK